MKYSASHIGKKRKTIQALGKKILFGLLLSSFFLGGVFPLLSVFSQNNARHENQDTSIAQTVFGIEKSFAEPILTEAQTESIAKGEMTADLKKKISDFASLMISIFTPVLAILIKLVESLMGDSYIMGVNGGDENSAIAQVLYELWLVFRDIMNYLFILILLFFAFMNIVPFPGGDNYALKTVLPKMIVAIVIINMTWFGARVVFDMVDVSARVVFGLPQAISTEDVVLQPCEITKNGNYSNITGDCYAEFVNLNSAEEVKKEPEADETSQSGITMIGEKRKELETKLEEIPDKTSKEGKAKVKTLEAKIENLKKRKSLIKGSVNYGPISVYWSDFNYDRFNQQTITPLFAYSIMQIQNLPRITQAQINTVTSKPGWSTLVINVIISLIIMIMLLVLFVLMVINLFFRVIVLWINIIFAPFLGLMIFKDELKISTDSAGEYLGIASFLKHAFAPVIMGLPMVIGFIMISVGKSSSLIDGGEGFNIDSPLIDNVSNIHQIFYYVMCIAVLWFGGVKAIESTTSSVVRDKIIAPIKGAAETSAKFIATSPMYINFLPVPKKDGSGMGKINLKNLMAMPSGIMSKRDRSSVNNYNTIVGNNSYEEKNYIYRENKDKKEFKDFSKELIQAINNGADKTEIYRILNKNKYRDYKGAVWTDNKENFEESLKKMGENAGVNLNTSKINKAAGIFGVGNTSSQTGSPTRPAAGTEAHYTAFLNDNRNTTNNQNLSTITNSVKNTTQQALSDEAKTAITNLYNDAKDKDDQDNKEFNKAEFLAALKQKIDFNNAPDAKKTEINTFIDTL